jgi:putative sigma-54 modulation protein
MLINLTARNIHITEALKSYIEGKIKRLERYVDNNTEAQMVLSVEKYRHLAEINLVGKGMNIHSGEESPDMYLSIDKVIERVERQLKKKKERVRSLKAKQRARETNYRLQTIAKASPVSGGNTGNSRIIETQRFGIKPMSVEEAVMQIDLLGNEFLVFNNSRTEKVNVLYKKRDGNFGLIEPDYEEDLG